MHTPIVHRIGQQGGFTLVLEQGVEPFAGVGRLLGCRPWSGSHWQSSHWVFKEERKDTRLASNLYTAS